MSIIVNKEYEKTGIMKITITSDDVPINFSNANFRIDILDMIEASQYYNLHHDDPAYNDAPKPKVFSITKDNANQYVYSDDQHLMQNGIQFWAENDNITMHMRFLQKCTYTNTENESKTVGFNTVKVILALDANGEDLEYNKNAITEFDVALMPGIHTGKIYKLKEGDQDPTLTVDGRRPDFYIKDEMHVNTSAGNSTPTVPLYCVNSSAFISEEYASEESEPFFEYDNIVSRLQDSLNTANYIDIPYTIIKDGTDLEELTLLESDSGTAKVKCKVLEIRQEITSDVPSAKFGNQLILSMDV